MRQRTPLAGTLVLLVSLTVGLPPAPQRPKARPRRRPPPRPSQLIKPRFKRTPTKGSLIYFTVKFSAPVTGLSFTVSFEDEYRTMVITPAASLQPGTQDVFGVSASATDVAGPSSRQLSRQLHDRSTVKAKEKREQGKRLRREGPVNVATPRTPTDLACRRARGLRRPASSAVTRCLYESPAECPRAAA